MTDAGWSAEIAAQERNDWGLCFEEADRQGVDRDEAEACDQGSVGCPGCPWKKEKQKRYKY